MLCLNMDNYIPKLFSKYRKFSKVLTPNSFNKILYCLVFGEKFQREDKENLSR